MKRSLVSVLVAIVVLGVAVFAAASSSGSSSDPDRTDRSGHSRKHDDKGDKDDRDDRDDKGHGRVKADKGQDGDHGPPAWAHRKGKKLDKAERRELRQEWREEWRSLSPEERRTLMDKLIREHMSAMREFRMCQDAGRDDCELPFPPGLARMR